MTQITKKADKCKSVKVLEANSRNWKVVLVFLLISTFLLYFCLTVLSMFAYLDECLLMHLGHILKNNAENLGDNACVVLTILGAS